GATADRLRALDDTADGTVWPSGTDSPTVRVVAATDPANPFGAALPWPEIAAGDRDATDRDATDRDTTDRDATDAAGSTTTAAPRHRPGRKAGALVVLVDGVCVLFVERGGRTVLVFDDRGDAVSRAAEALAESVRSGAVGPLTITTLGGETVHASRYSAAFRTAGFGITPKGLRIRR